MADPTSTAAGGFAAGASAFTIALLGVDHYIVLAAFIGAGFGVVCSPKLGLGRTISVFVFMTFGACFVGPLLAELFGVISGQGVRGVTFFAAALLHAAFAAALTQIEPVIAAWAKKLGANR
jgi:hypothetical protein